MTDHRVILEHKGFELIGIEFAGRWNVTVGSKSPRLLALVPQNSTVHAADKDEAFALARDVAENALRPRSPPQQRHGIIET